jgi:hypothetical protein
MTPWPGPTPPELTFAQSPGLGLATVYPLAAAA